MIKFAAIVPHNPIIVPTIGNKFDLEKVSITIESMKKVAELFSKAKPDIVIMISPHGPIEYQRIAVNISPTFYGDFKKFGDHQNFYKFENDLDLIASIHEECDKNNILLRLVEDPFLDYGSTVPLYYLTKEYKKDFKLISINYAYPDKLINLNFGKIVADICQNMKDKRIAIIASGDLSHRLNFDAPEGYSPDGPEFDKQLIQNLDANYTKGVLRIKDSLIKAAIECGYLSIVMLLGTIDQLNRKRLLFRIKFKSLSYQGPLGIGYLTGYYKF